MMTFGNVIMGFLRMNFEADDVLYHVSKCQTCRCAERGVSEGKTLALQEFEEEKILTFKQWNYKGHLGVAWYKVLVL